MNSYVFKTDFGCGLIYCDGLIYCYAWVWTKCTGETAVLPSEQRSMTMITSCDLSHEDRPPIKYRNCRSGLSRHGCPLRDPLQSQVARELLPFLAAQHDGPRTMYVSVLVLCLSVRNPVFVALQRVVLP